MAAIRLGPTVLDLSGIRSGDSNKINFTISKDGAPVDLTGYTISAQVRKVVTDIDPAMDAVCQMIDPLAGTFYVTFPGDLVMSMLAGEATFKGVWDIQVTDDESFTTTLAAGSFEAVLDVTRP